jgi:hypothetical protein
MASFAYSESLLCTSGVGVGRVVLSAPLKFFQLWKNAGDLDLVGGRVVVVAAASLRVSHNSHQLPKNTTV